eukprot:8114728-Pyramimonas_sp.AAC.1
MAILCCSSLDLETCVRTRSVECCPQCIQRLLLPHASFTRLLRNSTTPNNFSAPRAHRRMTTSIQQGTAQCAKR